MLSVRPFVVVSDMPPLTVSWVISYHKNRTSSRRFRSPRGVAFGAVLVMSYRPLAGLCHRFVRPRGLSFGVVNGCGQTHTLFPPNGLAKMRTVRRLAPFPLDTLLTTYLRFRRYCSQPTSEDRRGPPSLRGSIGVRHGRPPRAAFHR